MELYWQERRAGQRLILVQDDGELTEIGGVRSTREGFDAFAKTNTYDPGRARKGFESMEEAKSFVEFFHPWDLFGGDLELEVEPEVRPIEGAVATAATEQADEPAPVSESPAAPEEEPSQPVVSDPEAASVEKQDEPAEEPEPPTPEAAPVDEHRDIPAEVSATEKPKKWGWLFWKRG